MESEFSVYYKNKGKSSAENQIARRSFLLERQKQERSKNVDEFRQIEIDDSFESSDEGDPVIHYPYKKYSKSRNTKVYYKLQLSEWLEEKIHPENWFLVPIPKGVVHVLVVRPSKQNKPTLVYFKDNHFFKKMRTNLPLNTILDCYYNGSTKTFYVLDVLAYKGSDLRMTTCDFRFFWIKNKMIDDDLGVIDDSGMKMESLAYYDMENLEETLARFENFPMFENNEPELDGLLFYHKDSHYVEGKTPLVLWLFPFMVPEIFPEHNFLIDPMYLKQRPENYTNYLDFIKQFNEKAAEKKRNRRRGRNMKMDVEVSEDQSELLQVEELEELE